MPKGNGTGSGQFGRGMRRGAGQGKIGGSFRAGPGGQCICPACGRSRPERKAFLIADRSRGSDFYLAGERETVLAGTDQVGLESGTGDQMTSAGTNLSQVRPSTIA
jgi:hypothetical protein